jgi:mono/diheme cytochrome c family protein
MGLQMCQIKQVALATVFMLFAVGGARVEAEPRKYELPDPVTAFRPGPGQDVAENNCLVCHSSDYISTQPPGLGRKFWEAEVTRMRKAFGAQISDDDARSIADYLSKAY